MGEGWFKAAFGAHYPLLYQHRDAAEAGRCIAMLQGLAPFTRRPGDLVLDLGCGDGRHLELLFRLGIAAVGLDLSVHLLDRARAREGGSSRYPLVRGDMRHLPLADDSFVSVLSLFTAFGYFGTPADNKAPVQEVARVLKQGGRWYLDYFDGDRVLAELGSGSRKERERELGPLTVREIRRYEADRSLVAKEVHLRPRSGKQEEALALGVPSQGLEYTEQVAVFTLPELDDMAAGQGLHRVAAAGGYEGQVLGEGTRWILVYQKA
ncbi:MAG: class I SAM-dependent methyltransferase [Candidatus Krumholzibacteriota bacterium]